MAYIRGGGGKRNTFIAKRYYEDSLSGQVTIDRDGTFKLWMCLGSNYIYSYYFQLNGTDITLTLYNNMESTYMDNEGVGYTVTYFNASKGDVLSWNAGNNQRCFILFNE